MFRQVRLLQRGNFYNDNLRSAKSEYIYISDGTEMDLVPHFTFYGYRYVKIEGIPDLKKGGFHGSFLLQQHHSDRLDENRK